MTRYQQVEQALEQACSEAGDHWESWELVLTLDTPEGDSVELGVALDTNPANNAQSRYERACSDGDSNPGHCLERAI